MFKLDFHNNSNPKYQHLYGKVKYPLTSFYADFFLPKNISFCEFDTQKYQSFVCQFLGPKNIILEKCRTQKYHFDQILDPKLSD